MSLVLYELLGKDDLRFSPFAWRVRLALAHKGLVPDEIVPCRFTEKHKFAFSGQDKVPVLVDGPATIADSWKIACYLEDSYAQHPSLFGGAVGRGLAKTLNYYCDGQLHPAMARIILGDVFASVDEVDRDYFRKTREVRFGMAIEAMHAERERHVPAWNAVLLPARLTVRDQPFLSGEAPAYPDYILFGTFMWARGTSAFPLLAKDDPLYAWRDRMLDLFGGMARKAKGHPL